MQTPILALMVSLWASSIGAAPSGGAFRKLSKVEGDYPEFVREIEGILPGADSVLAGIDGSYKEVMTSRFLRFSESFPVNLDEDSEPETVSQVAFMDTASMGAAGADGAILYLVFVQDDRRHHGALVHFRKFELLQCDYLGIRENAMTFGFPPVSDLGGEGAFKYIRFRVQEVTSCGLRMESSEREDLFYRDAVNRTWVERPASSTREGVSIDRMELAE
ncbi:MAG: hypothetical protein H6686_00465 [Fibrobacteria bacterium]|nr:hypothetical protein [Fibrobacteria bacterium]